MPIALILSGSNISAQKWETELQTLRENNARLSDALQESSANIESCKKQLGSSKEECDALRTKVIVVLTGTRGQFKMLYQVYIKNVGIKT